MSRNIRVSEPSPEMQIKIQRARRAITNQKMRMMKCPYCGYKESKVVDSRPADEGSSIRRRRECLQCEKRFTTYETIESVSYTHLTLSTIYSVENSAVSASLKTKKNNTTNTIVLD